MEDSFKDYVNEYSINTLALSKQQLQEERDKRVRLSHKFSLTTAADFKWSSGTNIFGKFIESLH